MRGKGSVFWLSVRRHYEKNLGTVAEICEMFDISVASLYYQRRKEGWESRRSLTRPEQESGSPENTEIEERQSHRRGKQKTKTQKKSKQDVSGGSQVSGATNACSVGGRLFEVLEIKLAEIEDRIARGEQLSAEENEREQRVIGNLIRNFDKLTEFNERRDRGGVKAGRGGAGTAGDESSVADLSKLNAVQFREEIARRIEHFEKKRKS